MANKIIEAAIKEAEFTESKAYSILGKEEKANGFEVIGMFVQVNTTYLKAVAISLAEIENHLAAMNLRNARENKSGTPGA